MITHAAIVPLHYAPGHTEYNIILIANHYDDLIRLLTDPQAVLFAERTSHKKPGNIPPRFDDVDKQSFPFDPNVTDFLPPAFWMEAPITAIIRHGYKMKRVCDKKTGTCTVEVLGFREDGEAGTGSVFNSFSSALLLTAIGEESAHSASFIDVVEPLIRHLYLGEQINKDDKLRPEDTDMVTLAKVLQSGFFEFGGFYCEFAVATRTLHIVYYRSKDGQGEYSGDITDITMCKPTKVYELANKRGGKPIEIPLSPRGTVHFDLTPKPPIVGKPHPSLRSEFAGQILERPWEILDAAKAKGEYRLTSPKFASRGMGYLSLGVEDIVKEELPLCLSDTVFPDVTLDGLSKGPVGDEAEVEPCTVWQWREVPPGSGNYMWVLVVVKEYERSFPPPEILAQQAAGSRRLESWPKLWRFGQTERPRREMEPIQLAGNLKESILPTVDGESGREDGHEAK